MNKRDWVILATIVSQGYKNHRIIAEKTDYSIGLVNASLRKLISQGYLDKDYEVTSKTQLYMEQSKPKRAIILAAGTGLRMMPISRTPKCLLKVNDEVLIERIIKQLHEVGIFEIHVVVGYEMEKLEFLSNKFGVELIYDHDFARRDSLHSLSLAAEHLSNAYIVPASVWFAKNPFYINEYFSWYAISAYLDEESYLRLNRKMELVYIEDETPGNSMIGLAYLLDKDAQLVKKELLELDKKRKYNRESWERALFVGNKLLPYARVMLGQSAYEINTYEDLRQLDSYSKDLRSKNISLISQVFRVPPQDIHNISALMKGMTNNLMRFSIGDEPYLLRIPGVGSNELTNRQQEADVYEALKGKNLTDEVVYICGEDGYKIAKYWENSRPCDVENREEVGLCMEHLRKLHEMKLQVLHSFLPMEKLHIYENLLSEPPSFTDYEITRGKIHELARYLDMLPKEEVLCHIDPVSDNFLFFENEPYLIDWEYAGMSDPPIDIAMFSIYADYSKERIDELMEMYYGHEPSQLNRFKVYAYVAIAGLLWSVWCEYKSQFGVTFGEYAIKQYRYARSFHKHAMEVLNTPELIGLLKSGVRLDA
ncbi:MAG: phosphotransferase [Tissierellia bacterium]|nr:phosphotransferase [Tissierellia bacterium]